MARFRADDSMKSLFWLLKNHASVKVGTSESVGLTASQKLFPSCLVRIAHGQLFFRLLVLLIQIHNFDLFINNGFNWS